MITSIFPLLRLKLALSRHTTSHVGGDEGEEGGKHFTWSFKVRKIKGKFQQCPLTGGGQNVNFSMQNMSDPPLSVHMPLKTTQIVQR
uniref:Uncharacterized protein n=1 Tax=Anguilla anguilla TaxID=7936 RepID=A0A0E9RXM9_ANGAN